MSMDTKEPVSITKESLESKKLSKDWDNWVCPVNHSTWVFHRKYPKDMIKHIMKCPECIEKMGKLVNPNKKDS